MTIKMQPRTHAELVSAGELLAHSLTFGQINPAEGYVIASICDNECMSYLEFMETYNWMHASASMKADAMLARFCDMGGTYVVKDRTTDLARISVEFDGRKGEFKITWDDVKDEPFTKKNDGATKSNYATPRKRMQSLWSRAVSDAVHTICPQACKGSYTTEEAESFVDSAPGEPTRVTLPVPISPPDAAPKLKPVDATVCPIGGRNVRGYKWQDMTDEHLALAIDADKDARITDAHRSEIKFEIARRNKERDAEIVTPQPVQDVTLCPIGPDGIKGKPWGEFSDAELNVAVTLDDPALTVSHKAAIKFEIDKRKEGDK